jgi:hypothetical protein
MFLPLFTASILYSDERNAIIAFLLEIDRRKARGFATPFRTSFCDFKKGFTA